MDGKPEIAPPAAVLYAYSKLLDRVFLNLRNNLYPDAQERHDLGDALHNISGMLYNYGAWIDDKAYREIYLRPYDIKWGHKALNLEDFLEEKMRECGEAGEISDSNSAAFDSNH